MHLTPKEKEFCEHFIKYKGDDGLMAKAMKVTTTTIHTYRQHIYQKTFIQSKCELMYELMNERYNNGNN